MSPLALVARREPNPGGLSTYRARKTRRRIRLVTPQRLRKARGITSEPGWTVLRDAWVTLRSIQHCWMCRAELAHNEQARHEVVTGPGEFLNLYSCWPCNDGRGQHAGWESLTRPPAEEAVTEAGEDELPPAEETMEW